MSFGRNSYSKSTDPFNKLTEPAEFNNKKPSTAKFTKLENQLEDVLNKNNLTLSQIESLLKSKSTTSKNIDHFTNLVKEIEEELSRIESLLPDRSDSLFERYNRLLIREKMNLKVIKKKFDDLKNNFNSNNNHHTIGLDGNKHTGVENAGLLQEYEQYKVDKKDIKFMHDISKHRTDKMRHINEQIHLVDKCSKDMAFLTNKADQQISNLVDNVDSAHQEQKEAHTLIVKTNEEEIAYKNNKCCVVLLLITSVLFLLVLYVNSR